MALVDADYCFVAVDIGSYGSNSDGGIFAKSLLGQGLATKQLNLPALVVLPGGSLFGPMPYAVVGDEAFPLKTYLLRSYPRINLPIDKRIFNYRLSRARRVSENAFGILVQRWCIFQRRIHLHPVKCEKQGWINHVADAAYATGLALLGASRFTGPRPFLLGHAHFLLGHAHFRCLANLGASHI